MNKKFYFWFVGMCALFTSSIFATNPNDKNSNGPDIILYGDGDIGFSYDGDTEQLGQGSYLYDLWERLPNKQAFKAWSAGLKSKPMFIKAKRILGIALLSSLLYQAWIYGHTQCDSDGAVAQAMCNASLTVNNLGLLLKGLLINFSLGLKTFSKWLGEGDVRNAARLDDCLEKAITKAMEDQCWDLYSDIYDNYY